MCQSATTLWDSGGCCRCLSRRGQRIFAAAGSSEEDALLRREQDVALAEAMAVCMNESGFDYIAYVAPEVTAAYYPAPDGSRYPDPAFVERYGYGIVLPILDSVNGIPPRDLQEQSNPNGEIFMSLAENEQEAYIESEETCRNVAIASVPDLRQTAEVFELLAEDLEGIPDRVLADQRMIDYLVSRVGNSLEICCEGVEYLVCGLVPGEGFGVFVPVVGPGVDGVLEIGY